MEEHEHHHEHSDEHGHDHNKDLEAITVSSTRISRSVSNELIRIEVINAEELQENAMMRPGISLY
jgi:outer membrane receptor for ferrienterochelin and colicins